MKAKDVMTGNVISVTPDATVLQAARIMLQRHISGLPVIDKTGRLVGIVWKATSCVDSPFRLPIAPFEIGSGPFC